MERHNQTWTKQELQELHILTQKGVSTNEIAEKLKRTVKAVHEKREKTGMILRRTWKDEDTNTLIKLREQGFTMREISERSGWSMRTLEKRVTGLGLQKPIGPRYILMKAGLLAGEN